MTYIKNIPFLPGNPPIMETLYRIFSRKKYYFLSALLSLGGGLLILLFFNYPGFLRYYGGDILIIFFLYSLLMTITSFRPASVLAAVLGVAVILEALQAVHFNDILSIQNEATRVALGTNFDWFDITAYLVTGIIISLTEYFFNSN